MIRGCAHHSSPSAWVTQEWSHRAAPFLLPPATDALGLHMDMSCSMGRTILPVAGECARCSGHFPVPVFPLRSLSPASSCRPGGEVQWSAETSAPIRTSGRLRRRICHLRKAKRKNLEQRKRRAKKRGHRCTAGLLLGKALLCPAALNKPWNRTQGILENRVHDAQLRWSSCNLRPWMISVQQKHRFLSRNGNCVKAMRNTISSEVFYTAHE